MKNYLKILITISFLTHYFNCDSQIVMDTTDLPDIGTIQLSVKVDSLQGANLFPGNYGENITWDFSNLLPCCNTVEASTDTITWLNPQTTPNGQNFTSSNLSDAMNCYTYHSHVTHLDELVCGYYYYIKNANGLFLNGIDLQGNIVNNNYNFFPLILYGDSTINNARITKTNNDTLFSTFFSYKSIADAWGTVTTPNGTFNAIRIFTTESVFDSTYINDLGFQTNVSNNNYYYRWYSKGVKSPILEIYKGLWHLQKANQQKAIYSINNDSTSVNSQSLEKNKFKLYPNPVHSTLFVSIVDKKIIDKYNLIIYNNLGCEVLKINNIYNNQSINLEQVLTNGFYYLSIIKDNKLYFFEKLIKL